MKSAAQPEACLPNKNRMLLPGSPLPLKADSLQTTMTSSFSFFDRIAAENEELEAREAAMQTQEDELNARLLAAAQRERLAKLEAEGAAAALHRAAEQKRAEEEAREVRAKAAAELAEEQKRKMEDRIRAAQQEQQRHELASRLRAQAELAMASAKIEAEQRLQAKLEAADMAAKEEARLKRALDVETLRALKEEAEANLQSSLREFAEEEDARQALLDHLNAQEGLREKERKELAKAEKSERSTLRITTLFFLLKKWHPRPPSRPRAINIFSWSHSAVQFILTCTILMTSYIEGKLAFVVRASADIAAGIPARPTRTAPRPTSFSGPPPPIVHSKPAVSPSFSSSSKNYRPRTFLADLKTATEREKMSPPRPTNPKPKPKPKPPVTATATLTPKDGADSSTSVKVEIKPTVPARVGSVSSLTPTNPPDTPEPGNSTSSSVSIAVAQPRLDDSRGQTPPPPKPGPPSAASLAKLVALKAKLASMQAKLEEKEKEAAVAAASPSPVLDKTLIKMTHHWREMLDNESRYHQDLNLLVYVN